MMKFQRRLSNSKNFIPTVLFRANKNGLFRNKNCICKGCALSITIFNYAIDCIKVHRLSGFGHSRSVQISPEHRVTDLEYADGSPFCR